MGLGDMLPNCIKKKFSITLGCATADGRGPLREHQVLGVGIAKVGDKKREKGAILLLRPLPVKAHCAKGAIALRGEIHSVLIWFRASPCQDVASADHVT